MWKIFPAVCYWRIFTLYVFLKIPEKSLIYKFLATTGAHQKHLSEYKTEQKTQTSKSSLYSGPSDNLPSPSGCPEFVALASPLHEKIRTVFISVSTAPSCSGFSHPVALINIKQLKRSAVIEKWLLLKLTFRTYLFVFSRETHDPNTVPKRTPPPYLPFVFPLLWVNLVFRPNHSHQWFFYFLRLRHISYTTSHKCISWGMLELKWWFLLLITVATYKLHQVS